MACATQEVKVCYVYLWGVRQASQGVSSTEACLRPQQMFCVEREAELQMFFQGLFRLQRARIHNLRPVLHQAPGGADHTSSQRDPTDAHSNLWNYQRLYHAGFYVCHTTEAIYMLLCMGTEAAPP